MVILSEEEDSYSSSSSATPRCKYEVFLSFRGEDTRTNFTDHLYTTLKQKGINTFRDDERLEKGKPISELFKAIEESRFVVIVLSKNYANSKWCLDELAKIVERMEKSGMTVLPVFYHVDPKDMRHQRGTFAEAFAKHEECFKDNIKNVERWRSALREVTTLFRWCMDELAKIVECMSRRGVRVWTFVEEIPHNRKICFVEEQTWRAALKKVSHLFGWHLREDSPESEIIHQIVENIFKILHDTFPRVVKGLVGIKYQVKELEQLLCLSRLNDVRFIGIWGMGGIGKTTLAKVVCDIYSSGFEGYSFIKNVKDVSKESDFVQLQQLLCKILKEENIRIFNVEDGVDIIKKRLRSKKILLVLDDVNHLDQLKYLAEERDWFGFGSRIIITTRDQHLLNAHRVDGIHECKELNDDDALELLCLKAFKKEQPEEGFEEISQKIVKYANGLPLALDVLGSFLVCRKIEDWKYALERLKEYPEADIFKKLEISYDGLNNEAERMIFIHIACFLKGTNQGLVTDILESFGLYPKIGMDVLIKRSLITILEDNIVWVHDLLQKMGWEILRKQSPAEPGNHIGLKLRKDIVDVLTNNEGTKAIEIINQESSMEEVENRTCNLEAFSKMTKLRFLNISNVLFLQGIEYLSNELRILEWYKYPLKSLPSSFRPNEICELNMAHSQLDKLWEGTLFFPNLRSIDLRCSKNLTQSPDLTETPSLERLDLHECINLVEGHPSIFVHKRLNYLNLNGCKCLENLPTKIEMESLKIFTLSNCSKVKRIPEFGENMKCLEKLSLTRTAIEKIPSSIKLLTGLTNLNLWRCSKLGKYHENLEEIECLDNLDAIMEMDLWRTLGHLCCLEYLNLRRCNLFAIPNEISCLSSLKYLYLMENNFVTLPVSIRHLSKLLKLYLNGCERLQSLPELSSNLAELWAYNCTSLEKLPSLSDLDNWGKHFSRILIWGCPKLVENDNENENDFNVAILKRNLQGRCGRKVPFAMESYGRKIPQWFTHQNVGSSISIELPPNWCDSTWLGFALCVHFVPLKSVLTDFVKTSISVFALLPDKQLICPPMKIDISCFQDCYVAVWYVPRYGEYFLYFQDYIAFEDYKHIDWNQCSGNIVFDFDTREYGKYFDMKCGVQLVYEQDVEGLMQTTFEASGSSNPPSVTGTTT